MKTYAYRAEFEPGDRPGVIVVSFRDVPEAITEGETEAEARAMAADALGLALLQYLRLGRELPTAGDGPGVVIPVEADVAAKLAVIETFLGLGITKSELARRLGKDEKEVRRLLDPMHPTKLAPLAAALTAMGRRLVIGVADAA